MMFGTATETLPGQERSMPLSQGLLDRCRERAAGYDRENRFFQEDFEELRDAGYFQMTVPREFGGHGMRLHEVSQQTRRLAYYAAPTALACNMHHYWVGLAADLWRAGDRSCEWILSDAAAGEIFAAGHAESGNDLPLLLSTTRAERIPGGYLFNGRKSFGSLSPVWTRLGIHGMDMSNPSAPKIVHAFLPRGAKGVSIKETWDVLGMRATNSQDTVLENVFVPDERISRVLPAGAAGMDHFVLGIFAWALLNFGNIYFGMAQRIRDLAVESVKTKTSLGVTRTMAYHPATQHKIAEMQLALSAVEPQLDAATQAWSAVEQHGPEMAAMIVAAKYNAVETAWKAADIAMDLSGGFGMFKKSELERLFRDCRAGRFHPANSALTHELIGKMTLGIDLDEQPRWG
jgi:alkylation response protein AidB-like acyl-CoA dehydrogenase